jgi:hypothetical protein
MTNHQTLAIVKTFIAIYEALILKLLSRQELSWETSSLLSLTMHMPKHAC